MNRPIISCFTFNRFVYRILENCEHSPKFPRAQGKVNQIEIMINSGNNNSKKNKKNKSPQRGAGASGVWLLLVGNDISGYQLLILYQN